MMRALLQRFGADYEQWRALVRVNLKLDSRIGRLQSGGTRKGGNPLVLQLFFYFITGCVLAGVVATASDIFLSSLIVVTYAMFVAAVMILLDYHTVVTAPDDYVVLGFRPVSSRTYFAARVTNLVVAVLMASSVIALPCALAITIRAGMRPEVGAGLLAGVWGGAIATALAVVLVYGALVQRVSAKRLSSTLSYVQLLMSFVIYGGYMLLPQFLGSSGMSHMRLQKTAAVLLFPPSWFASYADIAQGTVGVKEIVPALLAIVVLVMLARAASGKISLQFAERLANIAVTAPAGRSARTTGRELAPGWLREGEARAVWILLRNQFRSDQKFRMAVLGILPLTVLYMLMAVGKGGIPDPFLHGGSAAIGGGALIYMAVMMFPVMLNTAITRSDNYRASWIFYATTADREKTIVAVKNIVFILFVAPYLLFTFVIFSFWFHNIVHALIHTVMLALLSHLGLVLLLLFDPQMPFSRPIAKGDRSARLFILSMLTAIVAVSAIPLAATFVYISATRIAAMLTGLWLAGIGLEKLGRRRLRRRAVFSEYMG